MATNLASVALVASPVRKGRVMRVASNFKMGDANMRPPQSNNIGTPTSSRRNSSSRKSMSVNGHVLLSESGEGGSSVSKLERGYNLYDALSVLPSLDIAQDRVAIMDIFSTVSTADHIFLYQPADQIFATEEEMLFMSARVVAWISDILLIGHIVKDKPLVKIACRNLERIAFHNDLLKREVVRKLFDGDLMMIVLLVGLQHGVHTECFNILKCCFIPSQQPGSDTSMSPSSPDKLNGNSRIDPEELIERLCSSGERRGEERRGNLIVCLVFCL